MQLKVDPSGFTLFFFFLQTIDYFYLTSFFIFSTIDRIATFKKVHYPFIFSTLPSTELYNQTHQKTHKGPLMQATELDQFLVDYHPADDRILVNCQWLQAKLLAYNEALLLSLSKDREIDALRHRILVLEASREVYELARSKQRYLNVGV